VSPESAAPIGILLIGHTPFASALMECARHVYGSEPDAVAVLDVTPNCDPQAVVEKAREQIAQLDRGRGVLVLTDLFGATPCNIASHLGKVGRVEILTGVNMPMLLRALTYRNSSTLEALVDKASTGATAGVMKLGSTAPQNQVVPNQAGSGADANSSPDGAANALARLRDQQ